MKAYRLHNIHDIRLSDEAIPQPIEGEVLLKVKSVGICGSDIHWWAEGSIGGSSMTKPLILGHEFSAEVASGPLKGQRVAVEPGINCGICEYCLEGNPNLCPDIRFAGTIDVDGAYREFLAWPLRNIFPLPESISDEEGAMLEPLGVAIHATRLEPILPDSSVGIYGCGPIGLMILQLAKLSGAKRIIATDIRPDRLVYAQKFGATDSLLADGLEYHTINQLTHNKGVDIAFEVAGENSAVETAIQTAKPGGKVVLVGITADNTTHFTASPARRKGLTIKIVRRMKHTYPTAISLVASKRIDVASLITHRFPLDELAKAFNLAEQRAGMKIMINV